MNTINEKILMLKDKLEKLIMVTENLNSDEVIYLSHKLDKLIYEYYLIRGNW